MSSRKLKSPISHEAVLDVLPAPSLPDDLFSAIVALTPWPDAARSAFTALYELLIAHPVGIAALPPTRFPFLTGNTEAGRSP
ncbi:hypothetical protein [Kitasatospora sp. GAS1066B]|uniref:hypothetical protein n=1 Tax=Kitasatospora sp. GAS1066B TaxID=3156271 RepID=UPI00351842E6